MDGERWIVGSLLTWPDGEMYILYDDDFATLGAMSKDPVFPETVGQFTGLKDKDGLDIYEGDIIHLDVCGDGSPGIVVYDAEHAMFTMRYGDPHNPIIYGLYDCQPHELEVVGNIHDDTELLTKTTN